MAEPRVHQVDPARRLSSGPKHCFPTAARSHYVLTRKGREAPCEAMMIRKLFFQTPTVAVLLTIAASATAQVQAASPLPSASTDNSSPVEPESAGFQLIEHRVAIAAAEVTPPKWMGSLSRSAPPGENRGARDRVLAFIRAAELRHRLPSGLLDALVSVESAYHPEAVSSAGAMGLAQLMPLTARTLGVLDPFDARANLEGGARFLRAMLDRFGSVTLALAAYNAGPAAVLRSGGIPANSETPGYVAKVLAAWTRVGF